MGALALAYLDIGALRAGLGVSRSFRGAAEDQIAMRHSQHVLSCFHTKASFRRCVLGVGVLLKREGPKVRCEVVFEPLASAAFAAGVRHGVFRNEFNQFLPLAVDPEHFAKALPHLKRQLPTLAEGSVEADRRVHEDARLTLAEYEAQKAAKKAAQKMSKEEALAQ